MTNLSFALYFPNIFNLQSIEYVDVNPADTEGQPSCLSRGSPKAEPAGMEWLWELCQEEQEEVTGKGKPVKGGHRR